MNNNYQAKNGFKTFIITLSVSIFVFSTVYYLVAQGLSSKTVSIEASPEAKQNLTGDSVFEDISKKSEAQTEGLVAGTTDEKLSYYDKTSDEEQVLAGADVAQTTQATVPVTGSNTMLVAFVAALSSITLGLYVFLLGPRKLALASFEKKVLKDL